MAAPPPPPTVEPMPGLLIPGMPEVGTATTLPELPGGGSPAAAAAILMLLFMTAPKISPPPPPVKKVDLDLEEKEDNKRVIKCLEVKKALEKVVTHTEISSAFIRGIIQEFKTSVSWADVNELADTVAKAVVEPLIRKIMVEVRARLLGQKNPRMWGEFLEHNVKFAKKGSGPGDPNVFKQSFESGHTRMNIRIGELHWNEQI